jgi:hypothetical protein
MSDQNLDPHHHQPLSDLGPSEHGAVVEDGGDVGLIRDLEERGIASHVARNLVVTYPAAQIKDAIEFYDDQVGVRPGLLVVAIREGQQRRKPAAARPASYDREWWMPAREWAAEHFPEYTDPRFGPHVAAMRVIRKQWERLGPDGISFDECAPLVHAEVAAHKAKYGD